MQQKENDNTTVHVIAERVNSIQDDVTELKVSLKDSMREISVALNKLVQIEAQNSMRDQQYESARKDIKDIEVRVDTLEKQVPMTELVQRWVTKAVWGAVVLVAMFAAKFMGLM